jgi:hypothetical protein
MPGGSFVGALISGFLTDWLGRKRAIQVGAVIWYVSEKRPSDVANDVQDHWFNDRLLVTKHWSTCSGPIHKWSICESTHTLSIIHRKRLMRVVPGRYRISSSPGLCRRYVKSRARSDILLTLI